MSGDKPWLDGAVSVSDGGASPARSEQTAEPLSTAQQLGVGLRQGIATGVGNIADAPSRVYNLIKAFGGTVLHAGTGNAMFLPELTDSNAGTNALKKLVGVSEPVPPGDQGDKLARATGEGIGASVIGANPMQAAKGLGIETLKMLGIGAGAGAGGELGGQATNDSALGRLAGGLAGGVLVPSSGGVVGAATRMFKNAQDAARDPSNAARANTFASRVVDQQVKDAVSGTPDAAKNITEALALREKFGPSFNPSVAEMANSPGLTDMQRRFGLLSPKNLNAEVARDASNKAAVRGAYERVAPEAPTGQSGPRSALNEALASEEAAAQASGQRVAGQLPKVDQMATGNALAEAAIAERQSAKGVVSANYQKAFDAAGDATVDLAPVIAKVEEVLGTKLSQIKPETAPNTVAKIRQIFGDTQGKTPEELNYLASQMGGDISAGTTKNSLVSLADADAIRKAVNADIAAGYRSLDPLAATKLRNLNQVHGALDEAVSGSTLPQQAKDLYADALNSYRTNYVPRFKEGANLRLLKDTSLNEPRILPDRVVSEYFKPDAQGGMTRAAQFSSLFGRNPAAKATTEKGILDLYRNDVVNKSTGIIDVAKHDQFMKEYGRTLEAFKGAGVNAAERIATIGRQAEQAAAAIEKFNSLAKGLRFDSTDDLVTRALADPKVMGNVTTRMTPQAKETFKRILMDKAWDKGTGEGISKYLADNDKTLRMVLTPKHLADLSDISKGLSIIERSPISGTLQSGGPDVLKNATGLSTATVWSQWRATTGGRQSPITAAFNLSMPVMNKLSQQQFGDIMEKALHDPNTARALREFLLAETPDKANLIGRILSGGKLAAGIAWDSKGPIARTLIGTGNYPANAERAAPAILEQMQ